MDPTRRANNPIKTLAALLAGHAKPVIAIDRLVPPSTYDLDYRIALVVLAFDISGKQSSTGARRVRVSELKLFQFVAQRPWLLPILRSWGDAKNNHDRARLLPSHVLRGYLADTMFDSVIEFLVARGSFTRSPSHLVEASSDFCSSIANDSSRLELFVPEREVLFEITKLKLTNDMLGGSW